MDASRTKRPVSAGRAVLGALALLAGCSDSGREDATSSSPGRPAPGPSTSEQATVEPLTGAGAAASEIPPTMAPGGRWAEAEAGLGGTPHVVLIVVDTLRQDHLGCYGYEHPVSPRIDEFAAQAARFEHVLSQAPWTTPSMGALHSSRYPSSLGIHEDRSVLREEETLLSEVLVEAGYHTGAVVSHSFCSSDWGFDQGFDSFDESNVQDHFTISSPGVSDRGIEFVDRHLEEQPDTPMFLWLHYFDPHFAYLLHEQHAYALPGEYEGPVEPSMPFGELVRMRRKLSPRDLAEMQRLYDSEIGLTDEHVGRFLDHLRARGLFEDSLIVLVADHGEEFMEHRNLGHAKTLYSEVVEVPMIVKVPAAKPRVIQEPVMVMDVFPTVLDYLDVPRPESLEGRSLLRTGTTDDSRRPLFTETSRKNRLVAVRLGRYKLIHDRTSKVDSLYDLVDDPEESKDLRPRRPEALAELSRKVRRWERLRDEEKPEQRTRELSPEERARLEALGYTDRD